ncbi:MAG TPA: caspase family protein, partial [Methyloceanibacter sp.]|nr:caspase family protein [Methyloceanibacter sp.]
TTETVHLARPGTSALDQRGTLYVVSIGVDDYPHFRQNLKFVGADARAFQQMLVAKAGPVDTHVKSIVLAKDGDPPPTAAKIEQALAELANAAPNDTIVLFLAGHGVNDGPDYLFLPTDAKANGKVFDRSTVVPWEALQTAIETSKGRRIMLVDTCHPGNAFNGAADPGRRRRKYCRLRSDGCRNARAGAAEARSRRLHLRGDRRIKRRRGRLEGQCGAGRGASAHVSNLVRKLTDDSQEPVFSESGGKDFVIGTVRGTEPVPSASR